MDVVDKYIADQAADKQPILRKLRERIEKAVPDAEPSIKWGVPVYARNGKNVCSLAAFKDFVGLNFLVSPDKLADPDKRLEGGGKTMRMLKVRAVKDIPGEHVTRWLKAAAAK